MGEDAICDEHGVVSPVNYYSMLAFSPWWLGGGFEQVNDEVANVLVAQLLYLANDDPEKDITLYINSPGGSVSAGMAIYDAMQVFASPSNSTKMYLIIILRITLVSSCTGISVRYSNV